MKTTTIERPQIKVEEFPEMPPLALELYQARERLKKRGSWTKRQYETPDRQKHCAVGLIRYSNHFPELQVLLNGALPGRYYDVVTYNDRTSRRKKDIISLYDRALASALEQGI